MPRVALRITRHVLDQLDAATEELGTSRDAFYARAIDAYLRANEDKSAPVEPGASRGAWERARLARVVVDLSDAHLQRSTTLAKRFDKPRDLLLAEAVAEYMQRDEPPLRLLEFGHDAPPEVPAGRNVRPARNALDDGHAPPSGARRER